MRRVNTAHRKNERGAREPQPRRRPGGGLEEGRRDDVLDLRASRQRIHREGERAQRDRPRDEALRDLAEPATTAEARLSDQ